MRLLSRLTAATGLFFLAACQSAPAPVHAEQNDMAAVFDALKASPPEMEAFLRAMPKGGDLHNHAVGSIYAENFIAWAVEDGLCVDKAALILIACEGNDQAVLVSEAIVDRLFYDRLIDGLSMRNYELYERSGHDQFFATFAAFRAAEAGRDGEMLAEIMARAGAQNILYLELMISPGMFQAMGLAQDMAWNDDLAMMRAGLSDAALDALVTQSSAELDAHEREARTLLACGTEAADPGCDVKVRYLAQVIRVFPAPQVFAQVVYGFHLARHDPRFVGLNLVAPEDDPVTLRDYTKQMQAVGFMGERMPEVGITLHAGELAMGLVPPEDLRFHIREAVEIAGADRIGHGVDIMWEDDPWDLLALMAERDILVEINLTSNAVILGIEGRNHPFPIYRAAGVPVALSTDDEGVSRIDLTHEYLRAVETFDLTYADVKTLSYNSLLYGFDSGDLVADLDARFATFEADWQNAGP